MSSSSSSSNNNNNKRKRAEGEPENPEDDFVAESAEKKARVDKQLREAIALAGGKDKLLKALVNMEDDVDNKNPGKQELPTVKLVVVLDASGSMEHIRLDMLGGINTLLEAQKQESKKTGGKTTFSLMQFNTTQKWIRDDELIENVPKLTDKDYQCTGGTFLFDAIGAAVAKFDAEEHVMLQIVTDGEDTQSPEFTLAAIRKLLADKQAKGWRIDYMCADQNGFQTGAAMGIAKGQNIQMAQADFSSSGSAAMSAHMKSFTRTRHRPNKSTTAP